MGSVESMVLVRIDAAGECPVLVRDGDDLFPGPDVRFRFVGETDDFGQAIAWMEAEHARHGSPRASSGTRVQRVDSSPCLTAADVTNRSMSRTRSSAGGVQLTSRRRANGAEPS